MSWWEYNDMFYLAQKSGKYHAFVFDMKGSRKGYDPEIILEVMNCVCDRIKELEVRLNKKILHIPYEKDRYRGMRILSDLFAIIIINNSISPDLVYKFFKEEKRKLGMKYEFHFDDGAYDTDDWDLGRKFYYRDYCITFLEHRSKQKEEVI